MGHFFHGCEKCCNCDGKGKVIRTSSDLDAFTRSVGMGIRHAPSRDWHYCSTCKGTGRVYYKEVTCYRCDGEGYQDFPEKTETNWIVVQKAVYWPDGDVRIPEETKKKIRVVSSAHRGSCGICDGRGHVRQVDRPCPG